MEHGPGLGPFRDLIIFLVIAGVIVPVFHRLRVSPVIGFLLGGVFLGPHGLASLASHWPWLGALTFAHIRDFAPLAELGVVVLLFTIGLELSFERLIRLRRYVFGLGSAQLVASALAIGVGAWLFGVSREASIILGLALALSSTAIVLPVLAAGRRIARVSGRMAFAILILQDLAVAPILIAVAALAGLGGAAGQGFLVAFLWGILAIAGLVLVGRLALRPLMRLVALSGSQELFLAACLLVALGAALLAAAAGQSMALGAFIAGLLLAETEFRHEIEVTIEPFKGLLLGLFFLTAGAQLDVALLLANPAVALGVTLALIVVKAALLWGLLAAFGIASAARAEIALVLAPAGEFAFVILGAGMASGVVPRETGALAAIAALLSMFLIPGLHALGLRLGAARLRADVAEAPVERADPGGAPVIVVGYGRVGQLVADMLERHRVPVVAVDSDPELVARLRARGLSIHFGDGSRPELLRRLGVGEARALVATSGDPDSVDRLVRAARAERSDLVIIARSRDPEHAMQLYRLGASDVVPETMEASLQLAEAVLVDIGVPMGLVIASVHEKRDEFRANLREGVGVVRPKRTPRRPAPRRDSAEPAEE
ncbi:MAG: cation:proton antiporter [Hyphomicrobiales bacterium]|nr:cation:proton antiporter [Hyphomicrobiales bacterium]MCA1999544.1 cation:proton antiporter [Hyphomicrobiales bacterium]